MLWLHSYRNISRMICTSPFWLYGGVGNPMTCAHWKLSDIGFWMSCDKTLPLVTLQLNFTGRHKVCYDDGEVEHLMLSVEHVRWDQRPANAAIPSNDHTPPTDPDSTAKPPIPEQPTNSLPPAQPSLQPVADPPAAPVHPQSEVANPGRGETYQLSKAAVTTTLPMTALPALSVQSPPAPEDQAEERAQVNLSVERVAAEASEVKNGFLYISSACCCSIIIDKS